MCNIYSNVERIKNIFIFVFLHPLYWDSGHNSLVVRENYLRFVRLTNTSKVINILDTYYIRYLLKNIKKHLVYCGKMLPV